MSALQFAVTRKPALSGICRVYGYPAKRLNEMVNRLDDATRNDDGSWSHPLISQLYAIKFAEDNNYVQEVEQ